MQRVRQSLPYFRENGWEPTIITVDEKYIEAYSVDPLLLQTFPQDIKIYKVPALKASITRKLGIGSLSIRSFFQIRKQGDNLLQSEHFDLIFFSTTAFHVMALGPRWKKKFGVPFVLDIQDPWYNRFYFKNALQKKSLKARVYHEVDKRLEAKTMPFADGIISVSPGYPDLYIKRYPTLTSGHFRIIPFGCAILDFAIAEKAVHSSKILFSQSQTNLVYIGRGGQDMDLAIEIIFDAINIGLQCQKAIFEKFKLWFIGTSYAQEGKGIKNIGQLAIKKGIGHLVTEITDRIPYFETLYLLSKADVLFVPGSTDSTYTASKIYPYIYTNKPMLAVFHKESSVCEVMRATSNGKLVTFGDNVTEQARRKLANDCYAYLSETVNDTPKNPILDLNSFEEYTARFMAKKQMNFFDEVVQNKIAKQAD
jgi:hypothetical protein